MDEIRWLSQIVGWEHHTWNHITVITNKTTTTTTNKNVFKMWQKFYLYLIVIPSQVKMAETNLVIFGKEMVFFMKTNLVAKITGNLENYTNLSISMEYK